MNGSDAEAPKRPSDPSPAHTAKGLSAQGVETIRRLYRWLLIAVPVGVVAGFTAILFLEAIDLTGQFLLGGVVGLTLPANGFVPQGTYSWSTDPSRFWALPIILLLAGLAVGVLATRLAPETLGHGTDETIHAFHYGRGAVKIRVPFLKFLLSALTIGAGGSAGREGPTAQIGSGLGSIVALRLGLSTKERRVALMVGMAAGIGAIFKAPFGAALLAAEVLYLSDFEPEVIMPSIVASVISYSIFGAFTNFLPEFAAPGGLGWDVSQLPMYALLGVIAGGLAALYAFTFNRGRMFFARWDRTPPWSRPAIGLGLAGLLLAALYYLVPYDNHVLSVGAVGIGYGIIQWLLFQGDSSLLLVVLIIGLIFVKIIATSLVVGSGGSGGLFGPGVVLGASTGFAVAGAIRLAFPSELPAADVAAFAVIGMLAFFGSVSKAPIAVTVMVVEMTGTEGLLVPGMMAIFIAYYVAGHNRLYTEQVPNRLASPAHTTEYFASFLEHVPVRAVVEPAPLSIPSDLTISEVQFRLRTSAVGVLPVADAASGRFLGEIRLADVLGVPIGDRPTRLARTELRQGVPRVLLSTTALQALGLMDLEGVDSLLVLSEETPSKVLGLVSREGIARFQRSPTLPNGGSPDTA